MTSNIRVDEPNLLERAIRRVGGKLGKAHEAKRFCASFYRERDEIRSFHNIGKGRRCFIIGNGPSLNKIDMNLLKDEHTFAVNGIFLKFPETEFRPTYYVVEDKLVAEDRAPEINKLRGFHKIFPWCYRNVLTSDEDTRYMNMLVDYTEYKNFPEFSTNASRGVWTGGTVTYINLQLAFYFGYDPVILVGIDHNYKVDEQKNEIKGVEMKSLDDDENHFHKDYFGKGYRWHDPRVDRMETAYHKAKSVFEAHGRKVQNATVGGKLEVYERVDFASLFP